MNKGNFAFKVGLFVTIALVATAGLVMKFSKGSGVFTSTYMLKLRANNVGGIIPGANVLMAGVPIGRVKEITLDADGRTVTMHSEIQSRFLIRSDAVFQIRQAGFLGDRFISVTPAGPEAKAENTRVLASGDTVVCLESFDFAEVARSASGLMQRMDQIVGQLNTAVARVDSTLLAQESLTNLTATIANFRKLSENAMAAVRSIDDFVKTNTPYLNTSVSNFGLFTENLNTVTIQLQETLATNRVQITQSIQNIEAATGQLTNMLANIASGQGLAGKLLTDDELSSYVMTLSSNLSVFSGNLNSKGLWGVFKKPKKKED
jgi:phospholipid/cholesterol/gamma-HCH transport system substrate-binding protein